MAFKTDQIKLKEDYANDGDAGTPVDGTLALIGATGSKELKIRDDGSWVAISGGGGGGGASQLSDLSDVPSAPNAPAEVGIIDGSNNLTFAKLTVANIDAGAINTTGDWDNNDTTLASTAAIQGYVTGQGYLTSETHSTQNYTKNYTEVIFQTLTTNRTLGTTLNQKYVISSDPDTYKFVLINPATGYTENTIIEIINLSNFDQIISSNGLQYMFHTNTGLDTINDITIGRGQRGLITVSENPNTGQNYFYVTSLTV